MGFQKIHKVKDRLATLWLDLQQTIWFKRFVLFCEACALVQQTLSTVCRQMRRTGLTTFEKLTYSALLLEVLGLGLFLLLG